MVMGYKSCLRGSGFKYRCGILDGHDIFQIDCCKNCIVCLKIPKINKKRSGLAHLKNVVPI